MSFIRLKFIPLIMIALLCGIAPTDVSNAQSNVDISLGSFTVVPGGTIAVPVNLAPNGASIGAVTVTIGYDPSVVSTTSADCTANGDLFGACNVPGAGQVKISLIDFAGFSEDTTLATILFTASGNAGQSTSLDISVATLAQPSGNSIPYSVDNGAIALASPNNAPTADAGADQTVIDGNNSGSESITLNGLGSSDGDGSIVSYAWGGIPGVTIPGVASPTIDVPVGSYNVTLTVTDDDGATATDTVAITVNEPANNAPTANAGTDQTVIDGNSSGSESITLNGSGSSDGDGSIASYAWSGIPGVTIPGVASPTIDVPVGSYNVTLTVTDDDGATATDTVAITVNEPANNAPTADAGADQTVTDQDDDGSESITLNGSGSSDGDGSIASYAWSGIPGVTIPGVASPTIDVPVGSYNVTLTVTDDDGATATDTVAITVSPSPGGAGCGPLAQEAESGTLNGLFALGADPAASGGQFVEMPDRLGEAPAGPDGINYATYCVTVAEAGTYRIQATAYSANSGSNSFYVLVDGQPTNGYLWSTPINSTFTDSYVGDRGGANPVELDLAVGDHEIIFALREDGTQLDKFALEPVEDVEPPFGSCDGLNREAEEGALNGLFSLGSDPAASGGQFVSATSGNEFGGPNAANKVDYCFTVDQPGDYYIKGDVFSPNRGSNSFYIKVDDEPAAGFKWNTPVTTSYEELYVGDISGSNRYIVSLDAGQHIVSLFLRESETRLDTLSLEPLDSGQGEVICDGLTREGEEATLSGGFVIGGDAAASGGQYIHVASGSGNEYGGINDTRKADLCFTVDQPGDYALLADVYSPNSGSNSFYVRVDDGPVDGYRWNIPVSSSYIADYVSSPSSDPVIVSLTAGEHIVSVYLRENSTRLDKMTLQPATAELTRRSVAVQPSTAAVYGTLFVQTESPAATVDPETVDFDQFSITLVGTDANAQPYSESASPDENGYYRFEDLPVGDYALTVSLPDGYESTMSTRISLSLGADQERRVAPDIIQVNGNQSVFLPMMIGR